MNRALAIAALIVLVAGCKKKGGAGNDSRARAEAFRSKVCLCTDHACVQKVTAEFAPSAAPEKSQLDAETIAIFEDASKCIERAIGSAAGVTGDLPAIPQQATADRLWRAARDWAGKRYPGTFVRVMRGAYVDAAGNVDPDHGEIQFEFGAPEKPLDDPKRRTGAPVVKDPKRVTVCPGARWLIDDRWHVWEGACIDSPATTPRCTIDAVWKRAIAKGAPADAVAQVGYDSYLGTQPWTFTIMDEPRNVNISLRMADDCELAVEQP